MATKLKSVDKWEVKKVNTKKADIDKWGVSATRFHVNTGPGVYCANTESEAVYKAVKGVAKV